MSGIEPHDAGAGSGLVNTAHQLGGSIGLALLTVVFGSAVDHDNSPSTVLAAHGYATVFEVATLFYVLAWSPVGGVSGWGWLVVALGFFCDLGHLAAGAMRGRQYA